MKYNIFRMNLISRGIHMAHLLLLPLSYKIAPYIFTDNL